MSLMRIKNKFLIEIDKNKTYSRQKKQIFTPEMERQFTLQKKNH